MLPCVSAAADLSRDIGVQYKQRDGRPMSPHYSLHFARFKTRRASARYGLVVCTPEIIVVGKSLYVGKTPHHVNPVFNVNPVFTPSMLMSVCKLSAIFKPKGPRRRTISVPGTNKWRPTRQDGPKSTSIEAGISWVGHPS